LEVGFEVGDFDKWGIARLCGNFALEHLVTASNLTHQTASLHQFSSDSRPLPSTHYTRIFISGLFLISEALGWKSIVRAPALRRAARVVK
jgi:hypothetical protein